MTISKALKLKNVLATSTFLAASINFQSVFACIEATEEYTGLNADWTNYCEPNNGWGEADLEMFCLSTWQQIKATELEDELCITERMAIANRSENAKA